MLSAEPHTYTTYTQECPNGKVPLHHFFKSFSAFVLNPLLLISWWRLYNILIIFSPFCSSMLFRGSWQCSLVSINFNHQVIHCSLSRLRTCLIFQISFPCQKSTISGTLCWWGRAVSRSVWVWPFFNSCEETSSRLGSTSASSCSQICQVSKIQSYNRSKRFSYVLRFDRIFLTCRCRHSAVY